MKEEHQKGFSPFSSRSLFSLEMTVAKPNIGPRNDEVPMPYMLTLFSSSFGLEICLVYYQVQRT